VTQVLSTDFTGEGIPDLVALDAQGSASFFRAQRPGEFAPPFPMGLAASHALALGDFDQDGEWEIAALQKSGSVSFWRYSDADDGFRPDEGLTPPPPFPASVTKLAVADLDNNGQLDLIGLSGQENMAWLQGPAQWHAFVLPALSQAAFFDWDRDGRLDMLGLSSRGFPVAAISGPGRYAGLRVAMVPAVGTGDGRINAFGIGSILDLRAAGHTQRRLRQQSATHFGLGRQEPAGLRIQWTNGTLQSEFGVKPQATLKVEQRLKGSCPWVFAYDGKGFSFVTDFLWGSPLGLQINAQAAASVARTFDRVRLPPGLPALRDSAYEVRITAELWETHFFDYMALTVVDHDPGTEAYVDERFCFPSPSFAPRVFRTPRPVEKAWGMGGADVTAVVRDRDGKHLQDFALGKRQGVAENHWVEYEAAPPQGTGAWTLLAHGWIYPTDSSVNRALGQAGAPSPQGLRLLGWVNGRWTPLLENLGFPAGKAKTILIPLREDVRRYRLTTNLEI
jgi:hypothetical protein